MKKYFLLFGIIFISINSLNAQSSVLEYYEKAPTAENDNIYVNLSSKKTDNKPSTDLLLKISQVRTK